ncbi:MAG: hypothetical protein ACRDZ5_09685, partial [Acidimicrobiales bacterium]
MRIGRAARLLRRVIVAACIGGISLAACAGSAAGPPHKSTAGSTGSRTTANPAGSTTGASGTGAPSRATGHTEAPFGHVFVVVMENESLQAALADPSVAALAHRYAYDSESYAATHPSLPNYLALTAGGTF